MNKIINDHGLWVLEAYLHHLQRIGEALHTDPDGPVLHVGSACLLDRVVVSVDDLVEVFGDTLRHPVQPHIVEFSSLRVNEFGQSYRG